MEKVKINEFLKDLSFKTKYHVLEESKDSKELEEVAKRHGIKVPCRDLAIFKGIYAFVDRRNLNGCTLPKEEVAKALDTIGGKAVDFDHKRKRMVGHWLEGSLVDDKIVSYGVFNKGNFPEDYEKITELMNQDRLKISMEAWGTREYNSDGKTYDFNDIEFSGGALLIETDPAFKGADVLELAKVMKEPDSYIKDSKEEDKFQEYARMYSHGSEMDTIHRMMYEAKCPGCDTQASADIHAIDFKNNKVHSECMDCGQKFTAHLTPYTNLVEPTANDQLYARKIDKITAEVTDAKKIAKNSPSNGDKITTEDVEHMEELKKLQEEVAKLTSRVTEVETENATLKKSLEEANSKVKEASDKLEKAETDKTEAVKLATENATKIAERKAELGPEFSKDMKDEDILDDKSFKIKQLEKENASLKSGKTEKKEEKKEEKASTEKKEEVKLEVGGKDKQEGKESFKRAALVSELAFGK